MRPRSSRPGSRSIAINLKGTCLACRRALPALRHSQGPIVNIAFMAARNAYPRA
jgi:NAD(P)-dependent dehydrogenase (short-subunit alcohol dehydrogenase family)